MSGRLKLEALELIVSNITVGRMGAAYKIMEPILLLIYEKAAFITGSNMAVNRGKHMY